MRERRAATDWFHSAKKPKKMEVSPPSGYLPHRRERALHAYGKDRLDGLLFHPEQLEAVRKAHPCKVVDLLGWLTPLVQRGSSGFEQGGRES